MEPQSSTTIYSFTKNEREKVRFDLRKYNGKYYVDLRLWFQPENEQGFKPSRKGLAVAAEHLPALQEGVLQLREAMLKMRQENPPAPAQTPAKTWKRYPNPRNVEKV